MQTYVMRSRDHCLWCGSTVRNWIHIGTTLGQQSVCYGSITVMHFRYDYTGIWVCKFQRCVEWVGMVLQWAVFYHNNKWLVMLHRVGRGNMLWRFVQTCGWHLTVIYWQLTLLEKRKKLVTVWKTSGNIICIDCWVLLWQINLRGSVQPDLQSSIAWIEF